MMYGANPEQLAQLGRTLHEQMSVIAQLMSTVDHDRINHMAGPGTPTLRAGVERFVQTDPSSSR